MSEDEEGEWYLLGGRGAILFDVVVFVVGEHPDGKIRQPVIAKYTILGRHTHASRRNQASSAGTLCDRW